MAGPGRRKLVEYLQRVRPPASTIFHSCMLPHPTCPPNRLPATAHLPPPTHRRALNHSCIAAASSAGHTKGLSRHRPPTHLPTPAHATGSMHLPRLRPPSARRLPRLQPPSALHLPRLGPPPGASPPTPATAGRVSSTLVTEDHCTPSGASTTPISITRSPSPAVRHPVASR
jgi:hypothetical protein